ncbi:MAG TPA: hypothetical protein DDW49_04385 [Deltaproteobacteria bacterium]|nr:MAG: hypothetical protein A2048_06550 [Deltaproteobacteria bacterium GWA2_45_12]HBF12618.1 hypothetical protein [Deltaproteobacteria bacterium]
MNKIIHGVVIVFLFVASAQAKDSEVSAIKDSFNRYSQAVMAYNGTEAAKYISQNTLATYDRYRRLALSGSKEQIRKEPLSDQINILSVRHKISQKELQAMNGAGLFAYIIDHQWTKKGAVQVQSLGKIKMEDGKVMAPILVEGKDYGLRMTFLNEDGGWKVDLPALTEIATQGLKWAAWKQGVSEEQFVEAAMVKILEKNLGDGLWKPVM